MEGRYPLLTDRKHLSFVPPDRTRQNKKITIAKVVIAGRVASETSFSEEEDEPSDPNIIYEEPDGSSSESENKTETERIVSVTYLIRLNRI